MNSPDEEMLSAYLDGALDADRTAEVERMIVVNTALAAELARLRANDALLKQAMFDAVPDGADAATLERFGLAERMAVPASAANDNRRRWVWLGAGAVAASAALFLVAPPRPAGQPWETAAFSTALDTEPSLHQASLGDGATLTPRLTVATADGRYCREFALAASNPKLSRDGIACRNGAGRWSAVALAQSSEAPSDGSRIDVAGGPDGSRLDAVYSRLRASDPLSASEERALIADRWTKK